MCRDEAGMWLDGGLRTRQGHVAGRITSLCIHKNSVLPLSIRIMNGGDHKGRGMDGWDCGMGEVAPWWVVRGG
jgi:hypothetical protein